MWHIGGTLDARVRTDMVRFGTAALQLPVLLRRRDLLLLGRVARKAMRRQYTVPISCVAPNAAVQNAIQIGHRQGRPRYQVP
jgi:hypothetical protein